MDATFRHGSPVMIDYTPGADVDAGDVIVLQATEAAAGLKTAIAHRDIPNGALGAVAAGGGVYDVVNLNNAANYAIVYWDDSAKKVTTADPTNNALFGFVVDGGGAGDNTVCRVLHVPTRVTAVD